MAKLIFENQDVFDIEKISYELDENNIPVDIEVFADENTLETICDHSYLGCNVCYDELEAHHKALYARLDKFVVEE